MSTSSSPPARVGALALLLAGAACSEAPAALPAPASHVAIDDMEGESGRIRWTPENPAPGALPGRWISYADVQCADLSPIPEWAPDGGWSFASVADPHETLSGIVSERAARLRTTAPLVNTWGAGMGFEFSELPPGTDPTRVTRPCTRGVSRDLDYPAAAVNLSRYSGLAFWAMASPQAGSTTVLVQLQDRNTDPRAGICDPVPQSAEECYNGFGVVLTLGDTFARYEIAFSELAQHPSWGHRPQPSAIDLEHVYGLVFQLDTPGGACRPENVCLGGDPMLAFDVWIDDLNFVTR